MLEHAGKGLTTSFYVPMDIAFLNQMLINATYLEFIKVSEHIFSYGTLHVEQSLS